MFHMPHFTKRGQIPFFQAGLQRLTPETPQASRFHSSEYAGWPDPYRLETSQLSGVQYISQTELTGLCNGGYAQGRCIHQLKCVWTTFSLLDIILPLHVHVRGLSEEKIIFQAYFAKPQWVLSRKQFALSFRPLVIKNNRNRPFRNVSLSLEWKQI